MVELQAPWLLYTDRLRGKKVSPGPLRRAQLNLWGWARADPSEGRGDTRLVK